MDVESNSPIGVRVGATGMICHLNGNNVKTFLIKLKLLISEYLTKCAELEAVPAAKTA